MASGERSRARACTLDLHAPCAVLPTSPTWPASSETSPSSQRKNQANKNDSTRSLNGREHSRRLRARLFKSIYIYAHGARARTNLATLSHLMCVDRGGHTHTHGIINAFVLCVSMLRFWVTLRRGEDNGRNVLCAQTRRFQPAGVISAVRLSATHTLRVYLAI